MYTFIFTHFYVFVYISVFLLILRYFNRQTSANYANLRKLGKD